MFESKFESLPEMIEFNFLLSSEILVVPAR